MFEALIILTPILMYLSYEIGKLNGQKALRGSKDRYITFVNGKLIEETR